LHPSTDADHVVVLAPDTTYVEVFDPRLYCFDEHGRDALVPDAEVVAHLGWQSTPDDLYDPPFLADQSFGEEVRTGIKEVVAEAVTAPGSLATNEADTKPHQVVVTAPNRLDVDYGLDLAFDVSVENATSRPVHLMLRPETLTFEIASLHGVSRCAMKGHDASPIAEVFTTVAPHAKASTSVLLGSICPDTTFRYAGLYTVTASLDTRHASGKAIRVDTFEGLVRANAPTLVRIRRDQRPRP
jgi:hypothetical protein